MCQREKSSVSVCVTPEGIAGTVNVAISGNGHDFYHSEGCLFTYFYTPYISYLVPSFGPVSGGTRLSIVGGHFDAIFGIQIDIGGYQLEMEVLNCTLGYITIPKLTLLHLPTKSSERYMNVSISMNKIDFYPGPRFLLHEDIAIKGIRPSN